MDKHVHDPLPSWHEGKVKQQIIQFVEQIIDENSPHYVPPEQRLATFDNDGTLTVEKPVLAQVAYFKRKILNADVINTNSKLKRTINWLVEGIRDFGFIAIKSVYFLRQGITTEQYRHSVARWIDQARHPRYQKKYTELAYQPMVEVLNYFQQNGFSNYIVSGSTANFIRPWSQDVYQVPANRIIGSSLKTRLSTQQGSLAVKLEPIPFSIENRAKKVLSIERRIAQRPIAAFGNSFGDVDMLRWANMSKKSLCVLIHHTDAEREYQYSPNSRWRFWRKDTLDFAKELNWHVVDMKNDWRKIFNFEQ